MNQSAGRLRKCARSSACAIRILCFVTVLGKTAAAQCVGDLGREVVALNGVSSEIMAVVYRDTAPTMLTLKAALADDAVFDKRLTTGAECLRDHRAAYRRAVLAELDLQDTATLVGRENQVRDALSKGAAAALAPRYSPTDRFGAFFGMGVSLFFSGYDRREYKLINRAGDNEAPQNYIVEDANSTARPVVATGLTVRFRERNPEWGCLWRENRCMARLADLLVPTTLYGALELGPEEGLVNGTALGFGWRLVGDAQLLIGYTVTRVPTLRDDLRAQFEAGGRQPLMLPAGETEESIQGTESKEALSILLSIPLALRGSLP